MNHNAMMRAALVAHRSLGLGQQLSKAVYNNDIDKIRVLLTIPGVDINYQGTDGNTALMNTVYIQNEPEIMRMLLAYSQIDVNIKNRYGQTALIMATKGGYSEANSKEPALSKNLECIRQLVAVPGIELNHIDKDGNTALLNTIRSRKLAAFKLLLEAGADPNVIYPTRELSRTPLMEASTGNYLEFLRILLAIPEIEINAVNNNHKTALYLAVDYAQRLNVQELLKSPRIDVNIPAQGGVTPILRASQRNNDGIIRDLLNAGAIVPTPVPEPIQIQQQLMLTEQRQVEQAQFEKVLGSHIGNVGFIKAQTHLAPSTVNTKKAAWNATQRLFLAVHHLDVDEVRRLLRVPGIDVNFQNMEGDSALYLAMNIHGKIFGYKKRAAKEILDMLLDTKGLNPNYPIHDEIPLVIALKYHDRYALQKLLNHKLTDVNAKDKYGQTALMHAIEKYDKHDPYIAEMKEMFDMILEKEPDINAVDNAGRTALFLASAGNKTPLIDALLQIDGIDVNIRNHDGDSAMSYGAKVWGRLFRPMVRKFLEKGAEVRPEDPPVVQEESSKLVGETLNKMSSSRRNPLNPNVMGEIKKFVGGKTRHRKTRRLRKRR